MKKTLLFLTFIMLLTTNLKAQIEELPPNKSTLVGKVGGGIGPFVASLEYDKGDEDQNKYVLSYNNLKYTTITSINRLKFTATEEVLNKFYDALKNCFSAEKGSEKQFKLGTELVSITTTKNLGISSIYVYTTDMGTVGYFLLTEKQLNKLFGK
jgi:hypothetical protein